MSEHEKDLERLVAGGVAFWKDWDQQEQESNLGKRPDRRKGFPRLSRPRTDYRLSTWSLMLSNQKEELENPASRESKIFRNRFRVPYGMFKILLEWTHSWYSYHPTHNPTGVKECDACSQPSVPVELKVLGVLRILGFFF